MTLGRPLHESLRQIPDDRRRLAYDTLTGECACGEPTVVRVETNGRGGLVDIVEPCAACRSAGRRERRRPSRPGPPPAPEPPPNHERRTCGGCGTKYFRRIQTGRPPRLGPCCR